eukprot:9613171-Alexandrium_andersonii.AAC.1
METHATAEGSRAARARAARGNAGRAGRGPGKRSRSTAAKAVLLTATAAKGGRVCAGRPGRRE